MPSNNFAKYNFKVKKNEAGKKHFFCPVRKKQVVLLPEEMVRQQFAKYLVEKKGYPISLMVFEYPLKYNNMDRRGDIVIFDKQGKPVLLVECKAPTVKISEKVFQQIANYNLVLKLDYLIITNGINNYCCKINHEAASFNYLKDIPFYEEIK